ncbi:hypothetical protein QUF72_18875 [Desulfobacterales bacterium HSG2]|nr:hypothetical protein [Desulfobacterales bacterium HSG2]
MKLENSNKWVVRTLVPEEVYTDRHELLDYFYNAALETAHRRTMSTVLLGQRRMGKTEIFRRVVNRLFHEQDPKNPQAVIPVYYSFPDSHIDEHIFAKEYVENFMRYYVGFLTGQPELVTGMFKDRKLLSRIEDARSRFPFTRTLDLIIEWHDSIVKREVYLSHKDALEIPRRVSDIDESSIVMFLDEFQNTRLPRYGFDIAGFMQNAVESPTCPHFVTGSAMSILAREIIGRGALFGRFGSEVIEPMSGYWGKELALRSASYYKAEMPEVMAPVLADRCGGNPFYITAVIKQAVRMRKKLSDEEILSEILAVDLSSGFIWGELNDQVTRWIHRINEHGITKWVLYLSALEENEEKDKRNRLNVERIQREIQAREGRHVSLDDVRDVLIKLSRGDLVEYLELGNWFRRVKDPILLEFLKVWGRIEVEGHDQSRVRDELADEYRSYKGKVSDYKGYFAEVHMSQVLLSAQDRILSGKFFHSESDIQMPWLFHYVRHRVQLGSENDPDIDVLGAAGSEKWVCQSKWVTGRKIGIKTLEELVSQADTVRRDMNPRVIRMWIFAHEGLTKEGLAYAEKHGILWSSRKEFDELLVHLGLRPLPEL